MTALGVILAATQSDEIKSALESLSAALTEGDADKAADWVHYRRMAAEIEKSSGGAASGLRDGIRRLFQQEAIGFAPWEGIRVVRIGAPAAETGEVEAFCVVKLAGVKRKFRFWLSKDGDQWKVFDIENMEASLRISTLAQPGFVAEALQQATRLISEGELEKARDVLREARSHSPTAVLGSTLDLVEGTLASGLGEYEGAVALFDRALLKKKDMYLAYHLKAQAIQEIAKDLETTKQPAKYEDAIKAEEEYLKNLGDDPDGYLTLGRLWLASKKDAAAIEAYQKGIAADEEDWENRKELASLHLGRGRPDEARPIYLQALKYAPDHENLFDDAAGRFLEAGAYEELAKFSREASAVKTENKMCAYYEGLALRKLGRFTEAEKALRGAVETNPLCKVELALTLAHLGREAEALAFADSDYHRACVYAVLKKNIEAADQLRSFLRDAPSAHEEVRKEPLFAELLKQERVRKILERAETKADYDARAQNLESDGRWEELAALARKRREAAPDDASAARVEGTSLRRLGRFAEAERAIRSGLEKAEENSRAALWRELAQALAHLGRMPEAMAVADRLAASDRMLAVFVRAYAHAAAKNEAEALQALQLLLSKDSSYASAVLNEPVFKNFLKKPAFLELLKKVKMDPHK